MVLMDPHCDICFRVQHHSEVFWGEKENVMNVKVKPLTGGADWRSPRLSQQQLQGFTSTQLCREWNNHQGSEWPDTQSANMSHRSNVGSVRA